MLHLNTRYPNKTARKIDQFILVINSNWKANRYNSFLKYTVIALVFLKHFFTNLLNLWLHDYIVLRLHLKINSHLKKYLFGKIQAKYERT